jgi:hypothetical protein
MASRLFPEERSQRRGSGEQHGRPCPVRWPCALALCAGPMRWPYALTEAPATSRPPASTSGSQCPRGVCAGVRRYRHGEGPGALIARNTRPWKMRAKWAQVALPAPAGLHWAGADEHT